MNTQVKLAMIIAVAAVACVGMWIYFSPLQECKRHMTEPDGGAWCALMLSKGGTP